MELKYKSTEKTNFRSYYFSRRQEPYYGGHWHFHEEYEIHYNLRGEGIRIVGDSMQNFKNQELIMTGPWLPHLVRNEEKPNGESAVDFFVCKFGERMQGMDLFTLPELLSISELLKLARRGLRFQQRTCRSVHDLFLELDASSGPDQIINLLKILQVLAAEKKYTLLASPEFSLPVTVSGENRLNRVIDYIAKNYTNDITLEEIAEVAAMTPNSFCRFFKSRTNKTAFQFINEYRISKACQMLINGEQSISKICFEAGFNSFSSFNRTFKKIKNISPGEFKEKYAVLV